MKKGYFFVAPLAAALLGLAAGAAAQQTAIFSRVHQDGQDYKDSKNHQEETVSQGPPTSTPPRVITPMATTWSCGARG